MRVHYHWYSYDEERAGRIVSLIYFNNYRTEYRRYWIAPARRRQVIVLSNGGDRVNDTSAQQIQMSCNDTSGRH